MPHVVFAPALQRHLALPEREVLGDTVASALHGLMQEQPRLRSYLLDDQGHLRRHVQIYVDGLAVRDRQRLSDPLGDASEVFVVQALTGG
jgi:molybdopterin converting factor small subunit